MRKDFYGGFLLGHDNEEALVFDGFDVDDEVLVEERLDEVFELGGDGHVESVVLVVALAPAIGVAT